MSKVRFVVEPSKEGKPPIALFHPLAPPISRVIDIEELHLEREKMILPVLEEWNSAGTVELVEYIPQQCPVPLPSPTINPIIKGSATVFIHGLPAARWLVSGDVSMCGAVLGSFPQYPRRTVWIGG